MSKLTHRKHNVRTSLYAIAFILLSNTAQAEIYKWRDHMGRTQYSDKPPVQAFTKINKSEIVNAIQSKELCAVNPSTVAKVNNSPNLSLFSFNAFPTEATQTSPVNPFFRFGTSAPAAVTTGNIRAQYSPLTPTNSFKASGRNVTVFGSPSNLPSFLNRAGSTIASNFGFSSRPFIFESSPLVSAAPRPSAAPVVDPSVAAPVVAAPAPIKVATAAPASNNPSPAPSNTPVPTSGPNIVQKALMPAVDISKNMTAQIGESVARIQPFPAVVKGTIPASGAGNGGFRTNCNVSHMGNDDPIVFPNQPGASHHHTFFGNTTTNATSNVGNMSASGNSTCAGGTLNRSAYWIPSMIETRSNTPIKPSGFLAYYKSGAIVAGKDITAPPKGLRMIAGNSKATNEAEMGRGNYTCFDSRTNAFLVNGSSIPFCKAGSFLRMHVQFPQCWDGKNLDSPNHQDHMAWALDGGTRLPNQCPATHPIPIPSIVENIDFPITTDTAGWRLASDNYPTTQPGGFSLHADWVNGWDTATMNKVLNNCLKISTDCGVDNLGDSTGVFIP